jgi:uncharacterized protein (TIGR02246 family)
MAAYRYALALGAAILSVAASAAGRDDAGLNALYEGIAAAVAVNDGAGVADRFATDAIVLDPRPEPPARGAAFRSAMTGMAARMKADGVKVRSEYRIDSRTVSGDFAVDTGYRRMTIAGGGAGGAGAQPMVQYHKFLVVARRQPNGGWRILRDASLPASEAAWNGAVRVEGLKYDG